MSRLAHLIGEIDALVDGQLDPALTAFEQLMVKYDGDTSDWQPSAHWVPETGYTRHLVARDPQGRYSLMLLCWNGKAASPCHDHNGSQCWMRVLQGTLAEKRFKVDEKTGALALTATTSLTPGSVCFINDSMGVHAVENVTESKACSLHLYVPAYQSCHTYGSNGQQRCTVSFYCPSQPDQKK